MKLEKLLEKEFGSAEDIHIRAPEGTKDAVEKKYGRGSISKIARQGIYDLLKK